MKKLLVAVTVVVALLASSCTSDTAVTLADEPNRTAPVSQPDGVPPALDFLGDLVESRGAPATSSFDPAGGSVELGEGASVVAADGAFAKSTDVTTQLLDLDFAATLGGSAPWSRAYVVSTVDDVSLGASVAIEIPGPAEGLRAVQIIDGEIVEVDVLGDSVSARIEIPHFSDITTIVLRTWGVEAAEAAKLEAAKLSESAIPVDDSPAAFLITCIRVIAGIFSDEYSDPNGFGVDLAMGVCTNALIGRSSPDGKYVSTKCVGDRISSGLDFQPAVDACAADRDETRDAQDEVVQPSDVDDAALEPLPDGTWEGSTNNHWLLASSYDVTDDELRIVLRDGQLTEFVYRRDFTRPDVPSQYADGGTVVNLLCTVNATIEYSVDGAAVTDSPGRIEIQGDMISEFFVPSCDPEWVPIQFPDGPESYRQGFVIVARDGAVNLDILDNVGGSNQPIEPLIKVE